MDKYFARSYDLKRTATPYTTLAPLYDALLGKGFFAQLRYIFARLVRRYDIRFTSAADVACGTGGFVHYLCERGVPIVYGMDRSPEMLRLAIAKNQGTAARFFLQDFAALQMPQPVDLITCHFDSLNYLLTTEDLLRALRRFRANLKPGGNAIFDMITDHPPWRGRAPHAERVPLPGGAFVRVTRWDARRGLQTARISISRHGRRQQEVHVQRRYPVAVVAGLLARAGFALRGVHDFQTLGPATTWTWRAVYVGWSRR